MTRTSVFLFLFFLSFNLSATTDTIKSAKSDTTKLVKRQLILEVRANHPSLLFGDDIETQESTAAKLLSGSNFGLGFAKRIDRNEYDNLITSKKRADFIANYLIISGISSDRIDTQFRGATSKFDKHVLMSNRRVEIYIK